MSLSAVRQSGRIKTRKKTNHMSEDYEYDENKFDPNDESNVEIQTKSNLDVSTNISDLLQSHSKETNKEIVHSNRAAFPNVLSKFETEGEEIEGGSLSEICIEGDHDIQILSCDICGKILSDISSYDRHMKSHSSDRQFQCGQCEKTFLDSCSLKRHLKTHEDDRPFSCEICQKSFRDTASISRHMLIHTQRPRTFQCSMCDKSFTDKSGLKRHERSHTGIRPFVCEVCQKAFLDSCSFKRHKKIHTGIKNFHCSACDRSFMEKQSLIRHQKTVCKLVNEIPDLRQDGSLDGNDLSNLSSDLNRVDNQNDSTSQIFLVDEESKEHSNHSSSNHSSHSLSTLAFTPLNPDDTTSSSNHLVSIGETQQSKACVKGQPSLGSLIQKDPGLYDSISEIVESIDSYEKMLDLCGDQGQKEIDAALTRDPVPMPNNLLCFECGELLVDGGNFKSEGKMFHSSLTNAFKCLTCEAAEEGDENEYGDPPVLMPHYDVDNEDSLVHVDVGVDDVEGRNSVCQSVESFGEQFNYNSIPMAFDSKSTFQETGIGCDQYDIAKSSISMSADVVAEWDQIEEQAESEDQSKVEYEADNPTVPSVFPCHLCTKVFASSIFLAQHLSLHKKSPHKCMVCTKSFTSGPALKRHVRLHTGEKPYICPICQKQFRDPSNFSKHKKNCVNCGVESSSSQILEPVSFPNLDHSCSKNDFIQTSSVISVEGVENHSRKRRKKNGKVKSENDKIPNGMIDNIIVDGAAHEIVPIAFDYDTNKFSENANVGLMGVEEEGCPVMTIMPSLDEDDGIDNRSLAVCENGFGDSAPNVSLMTDNKDDNGGDQLNYIPCEVCQKLCENQDHLDMHMNYHTGNPNVTCIECGKTFADSFGMKRHMRIHLGVRPYTCEYCSRGYCDNWSLKKHKSKGCVKGEVKVPIDLLHPCPKCVKVFCDEEDLQGHMKIHKGLTPMKYKCDVCHKRFSEAFNLKKHRRLHMAICSGCGQEFDNIQLLNAHQESDCATSLPAKDEANGAGDDKSFSCDVCGRSYSTRAYLGRHRKIHSDVKPHVCEICNKRFSEAFKLRRHKKASHSDEKPFICQDCGKCFSDNEALKRHAVSSSCALSKVIGEPVNSEICACQFCDKVFQKNYMLVRHMTVHSQSRPFACELCGRSYKDTSSLKRHQMIHQGVKDFICPNCGADFYYSDSLKRHMGGRCGKKNKARRRKPVSWTRPKKRNPKKSIPKNDELSSLDNSNVVVSETSNTQKTKLHTLPYIPTIVPAPSNFFSLPPAKKILIKESAWSCNFKRHCWLCDIKAPSASALTTHRRQTHCLDKKNKKRFPCPNCFFRLHKKIYWRAHTVSCHHNVKLSGVGPVNNNNNIKMRRGRSLASTNGNVPPDMDAVGDNTMGNKIPSKRPRRSVPRAKWNWISQI